MNSHALSVSDHDTVRRFQTAASGQDMTAATCKQRGAPITASSRRAPFEVRRLRTRALCHALFLSRNTLSHGPGDFEPKQRSDLPWSGGDPPSRAWAGMPRFGYPQRSADHRCPAELLDWVTALAPGIWLWVSNGKEVNAQFGAAFARTARISFATKLTLHLTHFCIQTVPLKRL